MLTLFVTYKAHPGMREEFLQQLYSQGLPQRIQQEDGCIKYEYYLSFAQNDEILLVEQWSSSSAQAIHLNQPHMKTLKAIKDQFIIQTEVDRLEA